jgi:hypothetical protein
MIIIIIIIIITTTTTIIIIIIIITIIIIIMCSSQHEWERTEIYVKFCKNISDGKDPEGIPRFKYVDNI